MQVTGHIKALSKSANIPTSLKSAEFHVGRTTYNQLGPVVLALHYNMFDSQRLRSKTYTNRAQPELRRLILTYNLSIKHAAALKIYWREAVTYSLLQLLQVHYMQLTTEWTKYQAQFSRSILIINQEHSTKWAPTSHQRGYLYFDILNNYLTDNDLSIMWYELQKRQPQSIINYLVEVLQKAPHKRQRQLFLEFLNYIKEVRARWPLSSVVHGIRATLTGKINRRGSARKQKVIWLVGTIRRADFNNRVYVLRGQAHTNTGALGLEVQVNYKDDVYV